MSAVDELRAINARFIDNFVTNDVAAHDRLLHPGFIAIQSDGSRLDRATYLRRWATGFDPAVIPYWDVRDELITVFGTVALVRATNKSTTGMTMYTDTYLYENGAWLCVQAQTTPVAAQHEPGDDTVIAVYLGGVKQPAAAAAR